MVDTTTVEGYNKYCDDFHAKRLSTVSSATNKLRAALKSVHGTDKTCPALLAEYELILTIEALDYYLRHTK